MKAVKTSKLAFHMETVHLNETCPSITYFVRPVLSKLRVGFTSDLTEPTWDASGDFWCRFLNASAVCNAFFGQSAHNERTVVLLVRPSAGFNEKLLD